MTAPARWRPARAGILNVYQYEDETLHFADGRLLLRGVNGSGKSTAMNMLLPFLLEADVRRIDAAGEQTGVLTSWMLADNEETQRTGYLWLEFARPDGAGGVVHHTVGCGLRANRNTNRTTPWWFSTPRRPRLDFSLTQNRVPLSIDALKAELGTDAVFTDVSDYRAEVARRFFGGADPSGYLRLLHQVRNPRVGDRIDADLPQRIREALPPVAEDAVADAAQPLEDLEDHRSNVVALERTDQALGSVLDTYRQYARRVVRAAADRVAEAVTAARSAAQARGRLRTAADAAQGRRDDLQRQVSELDGQHRTAAAELAGVVNSAVFEQVAALTARRNEVRSLEQQADGAANVLRAVQRRVAAAVNTVTGLRQRVDGDLAAVAADLTAARRHGDAAGAHLPLPAPPKLRVRSLGPVEGPDPDGDALGSMDVAPAAAAVRARRTAVEDVRRSVGAAEKARDAAEAAAEEAAGAQERAAVARATAAEARAVAEQAATDHRAAVGGWAQRWAEHVASVPAPAPGGEPGWLPAPRIADPDPGDLRSTAAARVRAATGATEAAARAVDPGIAAATLRTERATARRDGTAAELDAVRSAAELPLPRPPWQSGDPPDGVLFAALVDFLPGLDDSVRSGLEGACEAAGLLTAVIREDGVVVAASGDLLLVGTRLVTPNLGSVLAPVPGQGVDTGTIATVLAAVGLGAASGAALWVADDGRFGAGPLQGRHGKPAAEHIGAGARALARLRRIAVLEADLAMAERERSAEDTVRADLVAWRAAIAALVDDIPPAAPVDDAAAAAVGAVRDAQRAAETAAAALSIAVTAEGRAEQAWARAETVAAEHRLPVIAAALDDVDGALGEAAHVLRGLPDRIGTAGRSLHDWGVAVEAWQKEAADQDEAAEEAERTRATATAERTALAATEASLGDTPERIAAQVDELTRRRDGLQGDLEARRHDHTVAVGTAATTAANLTGADSAVATTEASCEQQRRSLSAVLDVDGLLMAACLEEPAPIPAVPETVDGAARLVATVGDLVPEPTRPVDEDALGRSLRQIRDALGAGWDAGSRRTGDGAPVAVEVSGPHGRRPLPQAAVQVATDLRRARGLLTAKQDQALRNLLHGRVARDVAQTLFEAGELVRTMNAILAGVTTSQGIGVRLEWHTRGDLDPATATALRLLAKDPDARTEAEDAAVRTAVAGLVDDARAAAPESSYRDVIAQVLDYRTWHELKIYLRRPGRPDELLRRRTKLSEGEKKLVTYLPMAAAASASAAAHDPYEVGAPRLVLLDDAFAKVSEDNHERLFGLLVALDLDFVVTSERLFGTHASVPALAIVEVLRDPDLRTIALLHYHWDGRRRTERAPA